MKSDRFLLALESLATVVMLVVWVAVAIEVEGALRAGAPVPPAAGDAGLPRPAHAAASGSSVSTSGIEPARDPGRGGG
jgi:hypothetical protein